MERNEAFAWQPQTPARQRTSSLSGACALLSKLSSHFLGSLTRESSQVCWLHLARQYLFCFLSLPCLQKKPCVC